MNNHPRWSMMFLGAASFNFLIGGSILFASGWSYRLGYLGDAPGSTRRFWGDFGFALLPAAVDGAFVILFVFFLRTGIGKGAK